MIEPTQSFSCPYCASEVTVGIDILGGNCQKFVYDCEMCCSPIACEVELDGDEIISFSAEAEA